MKNNLTPLVICVIGIIVRLLVLPYSQITNADAITRIFISEDWLSHPHFITSGIWLPIHHYLNALAIWISGGHTTGPIVMHIIFSSLTAIPIYHFTKREFSKNGAWFAAAFYIFCPVIFRNSLDTLSEIPFAFFIAYGINFLSIAIRRNDIKAAIIAGIFITIAAGIRYEAWLLLAVFACIIIYFRAWKVLGCFLLIAIMFPLFWMIGNYVDYHNCFHGISGNDDWVKNQEELGTNILKEERLKRSVFFIFSWFINYSPIIVGATLWVIGGKILRRQIIISRLIWALPFLVILTIYSYKALQGTLFIQHRFSVTLIVLSTPIASIIFDDSRQVLWKKLLGVLIITSLLPMSYVWMKIPYENFVPSSLKIVFRSLRLPPFSNIQAIPRLSDQNYVRIKDTIQKSLKEKDGLILDFITWDKTYYLALESNAHPQQLYIADCSKNGTNNKAQLQNIFTNYPTGVIVLNCYSRFSELYSCQGNQLLFDLPKKIQIYITPIDSTLCVGVFKYSVEKEQVFMLDTINKCNLGFPPKYSKQYYIHEILNNDSWYSDIRIKAEQKNIPIEKMLELDAEWMSKYP